MASGNPIEAGRLRWGSLLVAVVLSAALVPATASAGDEFERGFKDELGRIAAHESVAIGRVVLAEILGVVPPHRAHRVHRHRPHPPRWGHRHPHRHRYHGPKCGYGSYVRYEAWERGPHRYERYERRHRRGRYYGDDSDSYRRWDDDSDSDRYRW